MITRRSIIALLQTVPLFGSIPAQMGASVARSIANSASDVAGEWIKAHTREYNPCGGDMGRGRQIPVDEALFVVPALRESGFEPYVLPWVPTFMAEHRFMPVYGSSGALCASVWHAFIRERDGKHEIVAFEHHELHLRDFKARTGLTLYEAMEKV